MRCAILHAEQYAAAKRAGATPRAVEMPHDFSLTPTGRPGLGRLLHVPPDAQGLHPCCLGYLGLRLHALALAVSNESACASIPGLLEDAAIAVIMMPSRARLRLRKTPGAGVTQADGVIAHRSTSF